MPSIPKASENAFIAFWRSSCLRRLFHFSGTTATATVRCRTRCKNNQGAPGRHSGPFLWLVVSQLPFLTCLSNWLNITLRGLLYPNGRLFTQYRIILFFSPVRTINPFHNNRDNSLLIEVALLPSARDISSLLQSGFSWIYSITVMWSLLLNICFGLHAMSIHFVNNFIQKDFKPFSTHI